MLESEQNFLPFLIPFSIHFPILKPQKLTIAPLGSRGNTGWGEAGTGKHTKGDSFPKCQHGRSHRWVGTKTAGSLPLATGIPAYSPHPGNLLNQNQVPSEPVCRREKDGRVGRLGEQLSTGNEYSLQLPRRITCFVLNTLLTHSETPNTEDFMKAFFLEARMCSRGNLALGWEGPEFRCWLFMKKRESREKSGQVASCL